MARLVSETGCPGAVRVYTWSAPAVSVGRLQNVERSVRVEECRRLGVPVVRRPTGGRGVLHGWDLTIAVAAQVDTLPPVARSVPCSHRFLMQGIAEGLHSLGYPVIAGAVPALEGFRSGDCFAAATLADLVYADGTKAAGGAQLRERGVLLEQISIPRERPAISPADVFLGHAGTYDGRLANAALADLVDAVLRGLASVLQCSWRVSVWESVARLSAIPLTVQGCCDNILSGFPVQQHG